MGMSLTAEIMYGMVLYSEEETVVDVPWGKSEDDEEEDFEDWVCKQLGLEPLDYSTYPEDHYVYNGPETYEAYRARTKILSEEWGKRVGRDEYYAKKKELLATVPVEEDSGGAEESHAIILRLKAMPKVHAYYYPEAFDPGTLGFTNEEQQSNMDARDFLAQYGVEWAPKWLLVPSYG